MLPGIELMSCPSLAVPHEVMHHVVSVESSYNPYAIGVVGGRLVRQPRNLSEAPTGFEVLAGPDRDKNIDQCHCGSITYKTLLEILCVRLAFCFSDGHLQVRVGLVGLARAVARTDPFFPRTRLRSPTERRPGASGGTRPESLPTPRFPGGTSV